MIGLQLSLEIVAIYTPSLSCVCASFKKIIYREGWFGRGNAVSVLYLPARP